MARPPTDVRERALAAAIAIASRDGAGSMSIDAVAREAGVSKGGVLHHFPSKEALVLEVVRLLTAQFEAAVEAEAERDLEPVGRYVRAFLRALTDPNLAIVGRAMLSAVAHDLSLLEPMRGSYRRCQQRIARDGLDPVTAYQCILVADALWYGGIFDLPMPPPEVLEELQARLVASTRSRHARD
jgi:AcrR family transcriptional regulator